MACNSSTAGNTLSNAYQTDPIQTPDPRFRSAANDPDLRQARETGTYSSVLQYLVEPDAFGDGCMDYYVPFLANKDGKDGD